MTSYQYPLNMLESPATVRLNQLNKLDEANNRIFACQLISDACILLNMHHDVELTAKSLLHRFYITQSMQQFHILYTAMACCLLASKAEECPRSNICAAFYQSILQRYHPEPESLMPFEAQSFCNEWRQSVTRVELSVLQALGYGLYVIHPHRYVLHLWNTIVSKVEHIDASDSTVIDAVAQEAWTILNDCMFTTLHCMFEPQLLAVAALVMAARSNNLVIDVNTFVQLFDASLTSINSIHNSITDLRARLDPDNPVDYVSPGISTDWLITIKQDGMDRVEELLRNEHSARVLEEVQRIAIEASLQTARDA